MDPFQNSLVPIPVHAIGLLMVAGLLRPLARVTPGQFLSYWWLGWASAGVGTVLLVLITVGEFGQTSLHIGFCLLEYAFGYLVWAGCRNLATGARITQHPIAYPIALALAAFAFPLIFPEMETLFPIHAVIVGGLFALSLAALHPIRSESHPYPAIGLWLTRVSLLGTVVLFWHFAALFVYAGYLNNEFATKYMELWTLADLILEIGLAFGMVIVASDRVRGELEDRNRQLAEATAELARAARTDPLTGLFNRRALDVLLAERANAPYSGCLAIVDLNDLKPLNDQYGHQTGDAAIQVVARALRASFRVTDPLFRVGGDEFLIVLLDGTEAELRERMAKVDLSLLATRLPGCEEPVDLTIAWGVAEFDSVAAFWTAMRSADAAMYRSKSTKKLATNSTRG